MCVKAENIVSWANEVVKEDFKFNQLYNSSLNPYSTVDAKECWQRGFDNKPPRSYEKTVDFDLQYQRGRAMARLLQSKGMLNAD